MDVSVIIVAIVALVIVEVIIRLTRRNNRPDQDDDKLQGFPYEAQKHFLSPAELSFFQILRHVVENRAYVCSKVGLGDLFWVNLRDKSKFRAYRNRIDRKHVDFLLCNPATMRPMLGIELDDKSHEREDRRIRDEFVDQVFRAAGLPLLHIPAKRGYEFTGLAAQLAPYLSGNTETPVQPQLVPVSIPAPPKPYNQAPLCPKCGGAMILRTAKNGANAGNQFWGCSNYPNCRTVAPYTS